MRALVVVNPEATATSRSARDVLLAALGREIAVESVETEYRGHGIALGMQARAEGVDLVVALGGDGTVNELVNGLVAEPPADDDTDRRPVPLFAVVPGGSANVFVRALGFSRDPFEAIPQLVESVQDRRTREVGLGRVGSRWFTFNAGFGFDAEVIERVERYRSRGRDATPGLYVQAALTQFARGGGSRRRRPTITFARGVPADAARDGSPRPRGSLTGLYFAIVANAAPWTYLGPRPVNLLPRASFDAGLDLLAARSMRTATLARAAARATLGGARTARVRQQPSMVELHDLASFTLRSSVPLPVQVDGDFLGRHRTATFTAQPRALTVLAGPVGAVTTRLWARAPASAKGR